MQSDLDALRRTSIFADLPEEHLATLAMRVQHRVYDTGAEIFKEGDPGDALFVIQSGEVKLGELSATRQEIILATVGEGDMFGDLALLDGVPRSATAVAKEPTRCLVVRRDDFLGVIETQPTAIRAILRSLAGTIRRMNKKLADVAMLDLHGRMAKAFLELIDRHGQRQEDGAIALDRPITTEELAGLTGLYPVEVERLLRDYQYDDFIRMQGGRIVFPRPELLTLAVH